MIILIDLLYYLFFIILMTETLITEILRNAENRKNGEMRDDSIFCFNLNKCI